MSVHIKDIDFENEEMVESLRCENIEVPFELLHTLLHDRLVLVAGENPPETTPRDFQRQVDSLMFRIKP